MPTRRSLLPWCAAVAAAVALAGCSDVFRADFETDVVGEAPSPAPPGAPEGDTVGFIAVEATNAVTIAAGEAISGTRSLLLRGPTDGVTPVVVFNAAPVSNPDRPLTISYTGRFTGGGGVRLCVGSDTGACIFVARLAGGRVTVNGADVGTYAEGGIHDVSLRLIPASDSYSVALSGDAAILDAEGAQGILPRPEDFPAEPLTFGVRLEDAGDTDAYLIDDVRIQVKPVAGL